MTIKYRYLKDPMNSSRVITVATEAAEQEDGTYKVAYGVAICRPKINDRGLTSPNGDVHKKAEGRSLAVQRMVEDSKFFTISDKSRIYEKLLAELRFSDNAFVTRAACEAYFWTLWREREERKQYEPGHYYY